MRMTSQHHLARFRRIRELIDLATDGDKVGAPVAELDGVIQRLTDHGEKQEQHHREMRSLTAALYQRASHLRADLMVPVELAARSLYPKGDEVGGSIRRAVRTPSSRNGYEQIALAARGLAAAVEPRAKEFVQAGLPPDFITRLRDMATALEQAVNERAAALQRRLAATQGIKEEVRRGSALVKFVHSLMRPQLRTNAPRAAEWNRALMLPRRTTAGEPNIAATASPVPEVATARAA